jgi:GntR family transcriptional regulator
VPARRPQRPFERVRDDLRRRVQAGEWAPGEALPSYAALAEHYAVSQGVITRAVRDLVAEHVLTSVARWGVFVAGDDR